MPDEPINLPAPGSAPEIPPGFPDQQPPAENDPAEDEQLLNTCPSCSGVIDVSGIRPYEKIICPLCNDSIRVRTMFDHFTLTAEIGEGGMSRVFKANDNSLNREVALKILHSEFFTNPEMMAQFEREAKMTASINHPNVVQVYKVGSDQSYFYIAMELLDSANLEQRIERHGAIEEKTALRLLHETAKGLSAAFNMGLIHRDIKPGNILLDDHGHAKLVDFGLALAQGQDEDSLEELWATPFYVPPEKLTGYPDDHRGDIYSLGAAFFHALAGSPPYNVHTDSIDQLIAVKAQRTDLRESAPKLKEPTTTLINTMMAYDPGQRPQNYEQLVALIDAVRQEVDPEYAGKSKRNPLLMIGLIGGGIAVLVGFIALFVVLFGGDDGEKENEVVIAGGGSKGGGEKGRVVTAEHSGLVKLLDDSRLDIKNGELAGAADKLTRMLSHEKATERLQAWGNFQLGAVSLLEGDEEGSIPFFQASLAVVDEADESQREALREVLLVLARPEPAPISGLASADKSDLQAFATLLYGLKNRQHGELDLALQFLNTYQGSEIPEDSWMAGVGEDIDVIIADITHFQSAPKFDPDANQDELKKVVASLTETAEKIQLSPDLATQLRERAGEAQSRLDSLIAAAEREAAMKDAELIKQAREESKKLTDNLDFASAAAVWEKIEAQSPSGRQQSISMAEVMKLAGGFFDHFTKNIGRYGYQGQIMRRGGKPPFTAKIVNANATQLVVDLGFGPTTLDLSSISVEGLLAIAQKTAMRDNLTPELTEGAAYFTWICGDTQSAEAMAEDLAGVPGFPRRWAALTLTDFE